MQPNGEGTDEKERTLIDYWSMVLRRLPIIIVAFVIVFTISVIYTFARKERYLSEATFVIEDANSELDNLLGSSRFDYWDQQGRERQTNFYQALIASRAYVAMVAKAAQKDSILRLAHFSPERIEGAISTISLNSSQTTDLLFLSVQSYHSLIAYRVAVVALEAFRIRARQIKSEETRNVIDYVENQKQISAQRLEETERALQEFTQGAKINLSNEESSLLSRLSELQFQLTDIKTQRELAEANITAYDQRLRELKAPAPPGLGDLENPQVINLQEELERLQMEREQLVSNRGAANQIAASDERISDKKEEIIRTYLSDRNQQPNPTSMDQNIQDEIRVSRIKEEVNLYILKNRERYFEQMLDAYRRENPRLIEHAIEEAKLKRSKSVYENLYNIFLEKGEEARIRAASGTGGIRVIDEPTLPANPIPVKPKRNLMLGFILGLGLGLVLAWVIDYLDDSIRSEDDIRRHLNLPLMGHVLLIKPSNGFVKSTAMMRKKSRKKVNSAKIEDNLHDQSKHLITVLRPRDPIVDMYRRMCTNLQFASVDQPLRSILVTSALPVEGKTVTAANLALISAEMGKQVVIVDGDLRKPRQHEVFNVKRSPGMSDCLVKGCEIEKILYPTKLSNLKIIPCGTVPPNPAEMIASQRMMDFIKRLEETFDLVVFDSPPVNIVTDPILFSSKVTHTLLIIKFSSTSARDVTEAVASLRRAHTNILGVVLNGVRPERRYGYYKKYRYYQYYNSSVEGK